jgi:hypothetical protein
MHSSLCSNSSFRYSAHMNAQAKPDVRSSARIWRRVLDDASFEISRLICSLTGYQLTGTILSAHENQPLETHYQILCDLDWRTREVAIQQCNGFAESNTKLSVSDGTWHRLDGGVSPGLASCTDVDIEFTPATNALPVNRLKLGVGESAEILVAWIRVPSLAVVPTRQRYERLSTDTYRYTSVESGFQADIEVDTSGLPIRYGKIWERIGMAG